jgi:hypothetical protein
LQGNIAIYAQAMPGFSYISSPLLFISHAKNAKSIASA